MVEGLQDMKPFNGILSPECAEAVEGSCDIQITIADCQLKNVFSTLNNTLKLNSEWSGFEIDAKTKEETLKKEKSHREKLTSIALKTSAVIDICAPENSKLKMHLDKLMNAGNSALISFMNNAVVFVTQYDKGVTVTRKYKAQIDGLTGFVGYDADGVNETEISLTLYGNPTVINQAQSEIGYNFSVVADTMVGTYKVQGAEFTNPTQKELCDYEVPLEVRYVGKFEKVNSDCPIDEGLNGIIDTQLFVLKDNQMAPITSWFTDLTTTPENTATFSATQYAGYELKQVYAVILNNNGTYELLARVPLPAAITTRANVTE